jgi:hypothetical protein
MANEIVDYNDAIRLNPNDAKAYVNRGKHTAPSLQAPRYIFPPKRLSLLRERL